MGETADVIVVGARCAGSALAVRLARAGLRTVVLDRARFPSDVPSTHGIQPAGVRVLRELGCYDALAARTDPIERGTFVVDDVRMSLDDLSGLLGAPMLNLRRAALDTTLVETAAAAGAEVRTRTPVTGLVRDGGRVVGVETPTGTVRAPLVVGADGARSTVARLVGAREYAVVPPGRMFLWGYFEGTAHPPGHVWLGRLGDHGFLACPTDDGLFLTAVAPPMSWRDTVLADPAAAFTAGLRDWPELGDLVARGRRVGPLRTVPRWHGFLRESSGPGWVLVGDAGHFKDPTPGQGIADALRQSTTLATAVVDGLGGARPLDAALHDWYAWRDHDARPMARFGALLGAAGPTPLIVVEMLRRVAASPHLTEELMRVIDHERTPDSLFTTSLATSALLRVLRTRRGERSRALREAGTLVADRVRHRGPETGPASGRRVVPQARAAVSRLRRGGSAALRAA